MMLRCLTAARRKGSELAGQTAKLSLSTTPSPPGTTASAHYDLVVIGSGPAAQKCALDSAKRGKHVALIDKQSMLGGVCVHTGTIPSKTFREAVLHLTGYQHRGFYGRSYQTRGRISIPDLLLRVHKVESSETDVVTDQLRREGVEIITGTARFLESEEGGAPRIMVLRTEAKKEGAMTKLEAKSSYYRHADANIPKMLLSAEKVLVAVGTRPLRPDHIPFDGEKVLDSDQLLWGGLNDVPRDLIVVGAGVIGMEYASMISCVPGTTVYVVDPRPEVLPFADHEVIQSLQYAMRGCGARFLMGETVERVETFERPQASKKGKGVVAYLASGKSVRGDALLYTMGRKGNTGALNLSSVGLAADDRGLLAVNDFYQTDNPHIYACGDVIGYPALASTSFEQGRRAACHMWDDKVDDVNALDEMMLADGDGVDPSSLDHSIVKRLEGKTAPIRITEQLFPYGIYTIPEISMVGKTEQQVTAEGVDYQVGVAEYAELAKGQMMGGTDGFLKLIFDAKTLKLLGVHAIGDGATEIIHIGQVVMSQGGTIKYFQHTVFNYPSLAEAYNVAAADGLRKVLHR